MIKRFQASIACLPVVPIECLDQDDQRDKPWCVRVYKVDAHAETEAENLALDKFHLEIPIACLDDFAIYAEPVESNFSHERNIP